MALAVHFILSARNGRSIQQVRELLGHIQSFISLDKDGNICYSCFFTEGSEDKAQEFMSRLNQIEDVKNIRSASGSPPTIEEIPSDKKEFKAYVDSEGLSDPEMKRLIEAQFREQGVDIGVSLSRDPDGGLRVEFLPDRLGDFDVSVTIREGDLYKTTALVTETVMDPDPMDLGTSDEITGMSDMQIKEVVLRNYPGEIREEEIIISRSETQLHIIIKPGTAEEETYSYQLKK